MRHFPRWIAVAALALSSVGTSQAQLLSAADAPTLPPRLIVRFEDQPLPPASGPQTRAQVQARRVRQQVDNVDRAGRQLGLSLRHLRMLGSGSAVVELPPGTARGDVESLMRRLREQSAARVRYVEEDRVMQAASTTNDPELGNLWGLAGPPEGSLAGTNSFTAWNTSTGLGAVVAVIDTGYRPHADLAAQVVGQYDFVSDVTSANDGNGRDADASDPGDWRSAGQCGASSNSNSSWHGTHVGGTIAAIGNNGYGVAGVAYGAKLVIARVLGKCGGYTSDIADAIIWSSGGSVAGVPANANPAKVLNLSLGGGYPCSSSPELQNAINSARSRNATVVVAAGNSNADASNFSPASCAGVVAVASVGPTGNRASYSNYGAPVDVAAPGGEMSQGLTSGIESTLNSGSTSPGADSFAFYQGTSMATPHVAGVAALMYAVDPTLSSDAVESILKSSVRAFPGSCSGCGTGVVDAARALSAVIGGAATPLLKDVPAADLAGSAGSSQMFVLTVPAYAVDLDISLTPGSGSAQLFVKRGAIPTTSSYDCLGTASDSGSVCHTSGAVTAGTYYVMVHGVSDYSGYTLYATHGLNPPGTLAFAGASASVGEAAGTATVSVSRGGGSNGAVTVSYATSNGTATAGSDYTAKTGTLSWAAGDTADKSFTVAIINDTTGEPTETVNLTLSAPAGGAVLGSQKTAVLSIVDNDSDPGVIALSASAVSVSEAGTSITLTATRTGGSYGAQSVSYATSDGTAAAGSDYVAKTGTLSWGSGDAASKALVVTINNDLVAESTETFAVTLSNPVGGATLGSTASQTVSITDNDGAYGSLAFSLASATVSEGAGVATVTVTRSGGSGGAVGVSYATSNGTATAGSDYTASSGSLSWAAADPDAKSFTVPITDDTSWETTSETINLTLSNPTGGATLGTQKTATLSIADNDNNGGVIALSAGTATVAEGVATVTLTATRTGGNAGAVTVNYATADGTATAPSDYTARTGTLAWGAGDGAAKTFTVNIANDLVAESAESFGVSLSSPTGGATLGTAAAVVTVTDNDTAPGTLAFSVASSTGTEAAGLATVTVTRTGGSGGAVSVPYATSNGTATAGSDYTAASGTLSWAAGDPEPKTFTVTLADDSVWEPSNETINLALGTPSGGATLGAQKTATLAIVDNDNNPGVIALSTTSYAVTEGTATVVITATRSGGNAGAVGVSYATTDDTATAPSDYTAKSGTLSWAAGDGAAKTFAVTISNDLVAETPESFGVALSNPTGGATLGTAAAVVTVTDNDTAAGALAFSVASSTVSEAAGSATVTVTRTGGSGGAVTVAYATSNGTASAGSDYTATSGTLSWAAGDPDAKSFSVPVSDDSSWEPTAETITLTLSTPSGGATLGAQKTATISLTDNDNNPGVIAFSAASYPVTEGTATVVITATRTGGNAGAVGVSYATADDSATTAGDYSAKSGTLAWAAGDGAAKTFAVTITNDLVAEGVESFALALSNPSGGATLGTAAATVVVTDNDTAPGALAFNVASSSVDESAGIATVTVTRTGGSGGDISVAYATSDGTATAGSDYTATSGVLSWSAGDPLPKTFVVPISEDTVWESNETINLVLASPTGGATLGAQKTAAITINFNDNTPGVIALSAASYTVAEGTASVTITAMRSGGNNGAVGVSYATADDTAVAPGDYTARTGTLSWATGDSASKTFTVSINNDLFAESTESLNLVLSNPSGGAMLGLAAATLAITDNDGSPGVLAFSVASTTISEAGAAATITVTRSGGSGGAVTVDYATSNGMAMASSDYTAAAGTLSWGAADPASKTFSIPISEDATWEPNETINLTLSNPGGGATLGAQKTATVSIADNDNTPGQISFSAPAYSVGEAGVTVTLTATRSGGNVGAVGASYATSNGSATAGSDYTAKSATLSWAAADTAPKTLSISIANDVAVEGAETFGVSLSAPTGGATLGTAAAVVTIVDND